ncbi:MAG: DNA-directed RNA polymerase subunit omega [Tissierellia bacterium]|nr:DNA-directed RNA polymerase subunit omega [Tissierellia bacterium]
MLNPSFDHVMSEGDSRYALVMVTAKRARQLIEGAEPLIETESKKAVTIAIEEIVAGKVKFQNPNIDSIK